MSEINTEEKSYKSLSLKALTIPIFLELFLAMLMGNADTLMLSLYSDNAVAAVGVANQVIFLLIVMFGFVAIGTSIVTSQQLGANKKKEASEVAVIAIVSNLIFGIILSLLLVVFDDAILSRMNIEGEILKEAKIYLSIVGGFMFTQAIIMTLGAILRSHGFTKEAMHVSVGMNIIHIIGNAIFIFGLFGVPVLGVTGVAISSTGSRIIGVVVIWILVKKRIQEPLPFERLFKLPSTHLKNLLRIGLPAAGEQLSYNLSQFAITYFITMISIEAITTRIYTQNLMMFIFLSSLAIAQGTQIIIGHQVGAKEIDKTYQTALRSLKISIGLSFLVAVVFAIASKPLLSIFTDNPNILEIGSILLILTIILEPGRAFNLVLISSLRATGDANFPLLIGVIAMWSVSVPLAYVLGIHFGLGLVGIWIAFICDEWLRGLFMLWRWRSKKWVNKALVQ